MTDQFCKEGEEPTRRVDAAATLRSSEVTESFGSFRIKFVIKSSNSRSFPPGSESGLTNQRSLREEEAEL